MRSAACVRLAQNAAAAAAASGVVAACMSTYDAVRNWVTSQEANGNPGGEEAPSSGADAGKDRESTLSPGPSAGDSIPARGPERDFTQEERDKINDIGKDTGCHTCGSKNPGTKSGNFVPDHQPPNALNPDGGPQRLYPHCLRCSKVQGGQVTGAGRRG